MTEEQKTLYDYLSRSILLLPAKNPLLIAISGKDASGKTVMADNLAEYLRRQTNRQIIRISADNFMNERAIRRTVSESQGESCYRYTFNFDDLKKFVLEPLQPKGTHIYKTKVFDQPTDTKEISEDKKADDDSVIIIDGVFLFKDDLLNFWSFKILLETADDILIERGSVRDAKRIGSLEHARETYINRYIASQSIYYNEVHPEKLADIIINNDDYKKPFILKMKS